MYREPAALWFPVTLRAHTTCPGTATSPATTTCYLCAPVPPTATASPCTATALRCPAAPQAHCSRPQQPDWTLDQCSQFIQNQETVNWDRTWKDWNDGKIVCVCVRMFIILSLYYIQTVWAVFVPVNTTYLCCIVKSPSSTKCQSRKYKRRMPTCVRRRELEDDRKRKAKWLRYSCKFIWVRLSMCVPKTRLRPTSHLDSEDLPSLHNEEASHGHYFLHCKQTCMDSSGENVLITLIISHKKGSMWINAHKLQSGQIYTTCIVLVFLHIVSYFVFTYLKILNGIHILSLKKWSFFYVL